MRRAVKVLELLIKNGRLESQGGGEEKGKCPRGNAGRRGFERGIEVVLGERGKLRKIDASDNLGGQKGEDQAQGIFKSYARESKVQRIGVSPSGGKVKEKKMGGSRDQGTLSKGGGQGKILGRIFDVKRKGAERES